MTSTTPAPSTIAASRPDSMHPDRLRSIGPLLVLLGVGAATVALLGPLFAGVIEYHASQTAVDQVAGGDVAALFLVAPISIAAGVLVMRRHRAGAALALGPSVYAMYMYTQLALGNDIGRHPGNAELFFPLFLALVVLGGVVTVRALGELRTVDLPDLGRSIQRSLGIFLLVVATFLTVGLHLPGLVEVFTDTPSAEYLADPVVFWLVKMMDLGFVVPFLVWAGVSLLTGRRSGQLLAYAGVGWTALLGSSVAGMAIVMQVNGDPAASTANTLAFGAFAAIALAFAARTYRTLFARR